MNEQHPLHHSSSPPCPPWCAGFSARATPPPPPLPTKTRPPSSLRPIRVLPRKLFCGAALEQPLRNQGWRAGQTFLTSCTVRTLAGLSTIRQLGLDYIVTYNIYSK